MLLGRELASRSCSFLLGPCDRSGVTGPRNFRHPSDDRYGLGASDAVAPSIYHILPNHVGTSALGAFIFGRCRDPLPSIICPSSTFARASSTLAAAMSRWAS